MESVAICLPLEYWEKRKEFLKAARYWLISGKVRMVKSNNYCRIIFYDNNQLCYLVNSAMNLGAWMKSKGYRTIYNPMTYKEE